MAPLPQRMMSVPPKAFSEVILSTPVAAGPVSSRMAGTGAGFSSCGLETVLGLAGGVAPSAATGAGVGAGLAGAVAGRTGLTSVIGPAGVAAGAVAAVAGE